MKLRRAAALAALFTVASTVAPVAVLTTLSAATAGCQSHDRSHSSPAARSSSPSETRSVPIAPSLTPAVTTSLAPNQTGVSNGKTYTLTMTAIDGSTADGKGQWHVQAGQLSGGDSAVSAAFNKASQASARQLIENTRDFDAPSWTFAP
jgi:hypothetical protein